MKSVDLDHDPFRHPFTSHYVPPSHAPRPLQFSSSSTTPAPQASNSKQSVHTSVPPVSPPFSTRLTFQTFTSFIPWSSRSTPVSAPPPTAVASSAQAEVVTPSSKRSGGFVSREKQLRRLKARMDVEGAVAMKSCVHVHCKKCAGELVFI
jgi:hypothetical protein